ncbi:MAG: serine/threonine-protein kinase [Kofleriaceae bacterium]
MNCSSCNTLLDDRAAYCGHCGRHSVSLFDPLVGSIIDGRYRVDAKIAVGGFGSIYRATNVTTGDTVALKILHPQFAADPNLSARFRREATALTRLRDSHTVRTYELGEAADGLLYIAMELLDGESLLDRFRARGSLPWRDVMGFLAAACSSLQEAHGLGIVHRDLKPANIFLVKDGCVKVLDFGIAKLQHGSYSDDGSELTRAGQAIGTLEYMSPEQMIGGDVDPRTDIYTLGVVAYEMITGRRPFCDATGPTSLVTALLTGTAPPPSALLRETVPRELDAIIMHCLERDAPSRFPDVGQLALAISQLLARFPDQHPGVPVEDIATQMMWGGAAAAVHHTEDEPTWIDTRPVFDDVVRQHVIATYAPAPQPVYAPVFMPMATGNVPAFEGATGTTVGPVPTAPDALRLGRIAAWALGLLALGVALGTGITSLL